MLKEFRDCTIWWPLPHAFFTSCTNNEIKPTCLTEMVKHPHWYQAMNDEFTALLQNGSWILVSHPVRCKWVFNIKERVDGTIKRYKARLYQCEGVDYRDTYAPVFKAITIDLVFLLDVSSRWSISQLDVNKCIFSWKSPLGSLYATTTRILSAIFSSSCLQTQKILICFQTGTTGLVLLRSVYLHSLRFQSSKYDSSLFILCTHHYKVHILVYFDNIVVICSSSRVYLMLFNN